MFCHDDRHLLYVQDKDGDESWRLYLLDLLDESPEPPARLVTPGEGVQARIVAHNRWHPEQVLVALNDREPQLHDLHLLDLASGELTLVAENPGFVDWLVDSDLQVRGGSTMAADGSVTVHLGRDGAYEPDLEIPPDDADSTGVLGFTRDGSALLVLSSLGVNATRLERHDLATGERRCVAEDDAYYVAGLWLDPATLEPQAVEFARDRQEIVLLDESLAPDLERLRALATATSASAGASAATGSGRSRCRPATAPSASTSTTARPARPATCSRIGPPSRACRSRRWSRSVHRSRRLRDPRLPDVPLGVERRGLPAVVDVHGGPWARDTWGFDAEAQWLAETAASACR